MTKPIEPSKATLRAWYDAVSVWAHPDPFDDNRNTDSNVDAARLIQRHVDREVRKAIKKQADVVRCAEYFAWAWTSDLCVIGFGPFKKSKEALIAAVNAMKEGKG